MDTVPKPSVINVTIRDRAIRPGIETGKEKNAQKNLSDNDTSYGAIISEAQGMGFLQRLLLMMDLALTRYIVVIKTNGVIFGLAPTAAA